MPDPIFTPEVPAGAAPGAPPKRGLSNAAKWAIGCGALAVLGLGTCAGGVFYCGQRVAHSGSRQWAELRQVANELGTDAGATAEYASHPGLAAAYPTSQDFLDETRQWRPALEPLPEQMPSLLSGKISENSQYNDGKSSFVLSYHLASGRTLVATWHNATLADLQLE
jgi:hypothetical protein